MKQLRHVLRLYVNGQSKRSISAKVHLSRNTIRKYVRLFQELRLTSDDLQDLSDLELSKLFTSHVAQELNPRLAVLKKFYPYVDRELRKVGVTKSLLWEEYLQKYPDGCRFTQFCKYYTQWKRRVDPTVHWKESKAGFHLKTGTDLL